MAISQATKEALAEYRRLNPSTKAKIMIRIEKTSIEKLSLTGNRSRAIDKLVEYADRHNLWEEIL